MYFQRGCFWFLSFQARDLVGMTLDIKGGKATPYMGGLSRLFCRPFLFLSRWPLRSHRRGVVLIRLFLWKYHACMQCLTHPLLIMHWGWVVTYCASAFPLIWLLFRFMCRFLSSGRCVLVYLMCVLCSIFDAFNPCLWRLSCSWIIQQGVVRFKKCFRSMT